MSAAQVDGMLREPVLVFGSLPPLGRDLDLLATAAEGERLAAELVAAGWERRGKTLASFSACSAYAVDVVDLAAWAPSPEVAQALRDAAVPIPGYTWLRAPADRHRILVLARRHSNGMRVDGRKLELLSSFDPGAWDAARQEAGSWGLDTAVESLGAALAAATAGEPSSPVDPSVRDRVRAVVRGRRGPAVIALSGLDGAGKSTHAEHLRTALEALGYDVSIQWAKIAREEWLKKAVAPIRTAVNVVLGRRITAAPAEFGTAVREQSEAEIRNYPDGPPPPPDPAKLLRQQSRVITIGWTFVLAFANALTHRREVRRRGTRVVICDRYVLDSMAHLRYRYGLDMSFSAQGWVVRLLSPRATASFFLDVTPATARARKPEQYTTSDLTVLRQCYLDAAARLPVLVVDVEQPVEDVAARLAREAWRQLTA